MTFIEIQRKLDLFTSQIKGYGFYTEQIKRHKLRTYAQKTFPVPTSLEPHGRLVGSSTVARFMPLATSSFNSSQINPNGVFLGHDQLGTKAPVMIAPWQYEDPHIIVIGKTGSGKSTFVKTFLSRIHDLKEIGSIILDLEGEYVDLVKSRDGKVFSFGDKGDSTHVSINILDLFGFDPRERIGQIIGLFELIFDLSDVALLMFRKALSKTYHAKGITDDPSTWKNMAPSMTDLYLTILQMTEKSKDMPEKNSLRALTRRIVQFTKEGRYHFFDTQTTLDLKEITEKLVCLDLHNLKDKGKDVLIHVILQLLIDSFDKLEEFRYLVIEEGWRLLKYSEAENKLYEIIRRGRKHNLGLVFISQNVGDLREKARTLVNNSATNFLFKIKPSELYLVKSVFGLKEYMCNRLSQLGVGECFLITSQIGTWMPVYIEREQFPGIERQSDNARDKLDNSGNEEDEILESVKEIDITDSQPFIQTPESLFTEGYIDKKQLSDEEYNSLLERTDIEKISVWGIEKGKSTYLYHKDIIRNSRHEATVWEVVRFLTSYGLVSTTKKTVGADISTEISGQSIAIEVEMGTVPEKRIIEKVERLTSDYDRLFILIRAKDRRKYIEIVPSVPNVSLVVRKEFVKEIQNLMEMKE